MIEDQVHCLLRLAGCDQYQTGVLLEHLEPGAQISSAVVDGPVLDAGEAA